MPEAASLLGSLNAQQREAVLATEGPVLILAGAGSGKTRVITHRIAYLVKEADVPADAILAVTFTNKAAAEMKGRAEALLGGGGLPTWISTFHSLCVRLLRRDGPTAGLARDFVIYDEDDQLQAVRQALRALGLDERLHPPRRILSRISACKNAGRDPEQAVGDSLGERQFARVAAEYRTALQAANALDFDDLLLRAVALLGDDSVRESYRRRFRYVLVDEYQDTNRAQYELVRHLVGPAGNLTVVGDEDQSIYSWRGATIRNILDFEEDFPGARVLRLEDNYRSSQAILDAASGLVAHNRRRKGKQLRAVRPGGEPVWLHEAGDEFEEAAWVVERIAGGRREGRAAILVRTNAQSRLFEEALLRARIAYVVVGGVGFYQRKEVKDVLAYLRLLANPKDAVALRRVLNVPPRGIGERTALEIEALAAQRGLSPWEAIAAAVDEDRLSARASLPLARFRELIETLRHEARGLGIRALIERTLALSGYSAALSQEATQESESRLENLAELLSAAAEYEARETDPSLAGFLDRVSLLSDVDQARTDAPVVLMTLHAAKGLEFPSVFLAGLEEGLIPHARALEDETAEALEEERRLCYVGMTRAMSRLHLTWARSRLVFGRRRMSVASRFLGELPRRQLKLTGGDAVSAPDVYPARSAVKRSGDRPAPPPPSVPDQALRPGVRVRHPFFGEGTVVRSEGAGPDLKLTVTFAGVGAKRLVARYAGLEVV
jgi:DNA helicase-2/ATP-dependent DNA helicase PcrA